MGKIPGGAKILTKGLQQLDKVGQKLAPDLYHRIIDPGNLTTMKNRAKANPGSFSPDTGGIINSGNLKTYIDSLPDAYRMDFGDHFDRLPTPEDKADWSDAIIRAAGGESEAKLGIVQAGKTLELERTAQMQDKRLRNVGQQQPEVAPHHVAETTEAVESQKQIRTQSTERFDRLNEIVQGPEQWAILKEEGLEGAGKRQTGPEGEEIPTGQSTYYQQRVQQLSPHHLSEKAFDEKAIRNWSEAEQIQYVRDMNSIDIFPGNHPRNWIGLFHDNTRTIIARQQRAINQLRKEAKMPLLKKRQLDDWFKKDAHAPDQAHPEYGKSELTNKDPAISDPANDEVQAGIIKRNWSEVLPPGKTINDIKVDPAVISRDHQEFVHGITNLLPSTKRIKELQATGKWDSLPYKDRITLLMKNAIEKQNVAFNVALIRVNKIKEAMGKPNAKWDDIVVWIAEQPERAANIGWHKEVSKGGSLLNQLQKTAAEIVAPLKPKDLQLVANVFGMAEVPNSTAKFQQWLKLNE